MTLIAKRAEFATALSTVDDVTGYAYRPATPKTGDAWPLLGPLERDDGLAFMVTWRVIVLLPSDERDASAFIDAHFEDLVDALEPIAFVDGATPVGRPAEAGSEYALEITTRSE